MMSLLMMPQEIRKHRRRKKRKRIQYRKRKRRLQHRTHFIWILAQRIIRSLTPESKGAQGQQVLAAGEVVAVFRGDTAELVDAGDEGADEAEVDGGNEDGGPFGVAVAQEGFEGPDAGEHGDDEEEEDVGGCEHVGVDEAVDEPGLWEHHGSVQSMVLRADG